MWLLIAINFILLTPIYLMAFIIALVISIPIFLFGTKEMKIYSLNQLIAVDQGENAVTGGSPDVCISTRLWLNYPNSLLRKWVDDVLGHKHCEKSAENENQQAVIK